MKPTRPNGCSRTSRLETSGDRAWLGAAEKRVLAGSLDDLPPLNSKVIRVFTSSTFTDTQLERNTLMVHVYPKLKEYCREKHGIEFQVVDMRWGVTDEALDDHMTIEVCLNEIRNCQKMSIGPNFMVSITV
ncbi:hypothetical protein LSH36_145g04060 [Paralvinella palmiformis]|uniref:DUF4062 domain-containing protein n=1 Tax=Paralvinella palmiformis TaxID=53620 RepID=A0AAD9JW75_9ANNE|nr:hypothetical protein LSH36_145g04060 [Paralvinella palmiformis]